MNRSASSPSATMPTMRLHTRRQSNSSWPWVPLGSRLPLSYSGSARAATAAPASHGSKCASQPARCDVPLLEAQLHTLYPRSAVVTHEFDPEGADLEWADRICGGDDRGASALCGASLPRRALLPPDPHVFQARHRSFGPGDCRPGRIRRRGMGGGAGVVLPGQTSLGREPPAWPAKTPIGRGT